jgi:pimeloyl-ACP methyl ester carboxylesterase
MTSFLTIKEDRKIAYNQILGKTPGIVFLGGFMSDRSGKKAIYLESLCQSLGHAYVRFDYFGHGESTGLFTEGTIGIWKEDALAVLDELTQGPQILVGSSMGGWLMLLVALARKERIKSLIGIAAAPDFTEEFKKLSSTQKEALEKNGVCYLPSQYGESPYPITRQLIEEGKQQVLLKDKIPITCPVHLLHGMQDKSVTWEKAIKLGECLETQEVVVTLIKDGEHSLSRDSDLEKLEEALLNSLRLIDASG